MGLFRRHGFSVALAVSMPLLTMVSAHAAEAQQSVTGQSSGFETRLPVFEMHSGFWVNLHHFLYLQARLAMGKSTLPTESVRGAAQPDELPVSLMDFPRAEIQAWQDAVAFYTKDLAGRDLLLNGDMEIINNQLSLLESCPDLEGKTTPLCKSGLRQDLVEAQWRVVQPILGNVAPVYDYQPGTWGPEEAHQLIGIDGPWMDPKAPEEQK